MKKTIATLCVLGVGASSAHAQSTVTVYGIIDASVAYTNTAAAVSASNPRGTGNLMQVTSGTIQQSRFGFKGQEDLGGGLSAQFVLEGGFSGDTGASGNSQLGSTSGTLFGRASYVGLSSKSFGTLQIGRRKDFTDQIATYYSSVVDFGTLINGVHDNNMDRVGGNRANNMVSYYTPQIAGITANVAYAFGETAGSASTGNAYGFGANYNNGPFGVGFAYWAAKTGSAANTESDQSLNALCAAGTFGAPGTTCLKTFNVGSSYTTGPFRFFGMFSRTKQPNAVAATTAAPNFTTGAFTSAANTGTFSASGTNNDRTNVIDLGVNYNITPALKLTTSVLQSRSSFIGSAVSGKVTQLNLGADYFFSKRTDVYLNTSFQRTSNMYSPGITVAPGADKSQFIVMTGIRTTF